MPSGPPICALRASGRRISGNDCSGWPTPCQQDGPKGGPSQGVDRLPAAAQMAGWPTPNAIPETRGGLQGNPAKALERRSQGHALNLDDAACLSGWVSPPAQDGSRGVLPPRPQDTGIPLSQQVSGLKQSPSSALTENAAAYRLNPRFSLWLMGFPIVWARCAERVTRSSRKSRRNS